MDKELKNLQNKVVADPNDYEAIVRLKNYLERLHKRKKVWKHLQVSYNPELEKNIQLLENEGYTIFTVFSSSSNGGFNIIYEIIAYKYKVFDGR